MTGNYPPPPLQPRPRSVKLAEPLLLPDPRHVPSTAYAVRVQARDVAGNYSTSARLRSCRSSQEIRVETTATTDWPGVVAYSRSVDL